MSIPYRPATGAGPLKLVRSQRLGLWPVPHCSSPSNSRLHTASQHRAQSAASDVVATAPVRPAPFLSCHRRARSPLHSTPLCRARAGLLISSVLRPAAFVLDIAPEYRFRLLLRYSQPAAAPPPPRYLGTSSPLLSCQAVGLCQSIVPGHGPKHGTGPRAMLG